MKIRATNKVLNIARITAAKDPAPLVDEMPGEWYADIVSMGLPGKLAIHFLHYPTLVSVIIPEKSLKKALSYLPEHLESLLFRQGFSKLLSEYQINTEPEIFSTNNKSMLGYLKEMKFTIEYHLKDLRPIPEIEDIEFNNIFGGKLAGNRYARPRMILGGMGEGGT
jgi:hypothetical protein